MKKGFLVTFEGGEGCGKSTQVKRFVQYLQEKGIDFVQSREPGGTEVGEKIREILTHDKSKVSPKVDTFLLCACRAKIVEEVVRPALEEGKVMVLDRFYDAFYAYQGYGEGVDLKMLKNITEYVVGKDIVPDLTFLFDLSYEEGMSRKAKNENLKNLDRYEVRGGEYFKRVRDGYLKIAKREKKRFVVIDASQDMDAIFNQIVEVFTERLNKKRG